MRTGQQLFRVERLNVEAHELSTRVFVVAARSPRGAVRVVRNNFRHVITDHVRRERNPLHVLGTDYVSDRVGRVL